MVASSGGVKLSAFEQILALGTDLKSLDRQASAKPVHEEFPPPLRTPGIVTPDLLHQMATSLSQLSAPPQTSMSAQTSLSTRLSQASDVTSRDHGPAQARTNQSHGQAYWHADDTRTTPSEHDGHWLPFDDHAAPRFLDSSENGDAGAALPQTYDDRRALEAANQAASRFGREPLMLQPDEVRHTRLRRNRSALLAVTAVLVAGGLFVHSGRLDASRHGPAKIECLDTKGRPGECARLNFGAAPAFKASLNILSTLPAEQLESFATPTGSFAVPRQDAALNIRLDRSTLAQPVVRPTAQIGLDLVFDPGDRTSLLLPLAVHGGEESHPLDLVLIKGLPPGSTLSAGTQLSSDQWAIQAVALSGLRLSLTDEAPGRFVMTVEVMRHSGDILARSSIAVRSTDWKPARRKLSQADGRHWLIDERAEVASAVSTSRPTKRIASIDPLAGLEIAASAIQPVVAEPARIAHPRLTLEPVLLQAPKPARPAPRVASIADAPMGAPALEAAEPLVVTAPPPPLPVEKPNHRSATSSAHGESGESSSQRVAVVQPREPHQPMDAPSTTLGIKSRPLPEWALSAFGWK